MPRVTIRAEDAGDLIASIVKIENTLAECNDSPLREERYQVLHSVKVVDGRQEAWNAGENFDLLEEIDHPHSHLLRHWRRGDYYHRYSVVPAFLVNKLIKLLSISEKLQTN